MDYLLKNLNLFSGKGNEALKNAAIWVAGSKIKFAGSFEALPEMPQGTVEKDLAGKFVMAGMTETHAHLSFVDASPFAIGETLVEEATLTAVRNARLMLGSGFTSAVSFGSTYKIDVALRDAISQGSVIAPFIYSIF